MEQKFVASSSNGQQIVQKVQLVQGHANLNQTGQQTQQLTSLNGQPVTFVQVQTPSRDQPLQ